MKVGDKVKTPFNEVDTIIAINDGLCYLRFVKSAYPKSYLTNIKDINNEYV